MPITILAPTNLTVSRGPYPTPTSVGSFPNGLATPAGGIAPYTFFISGGIIPKGLHMNPVTGNLTGSTIEVGQFIFKYKVYDSTNEQSNEITTTLTITDLQGPAILAIAPKVFTQGDYISQELVMLTDWDTFDTYTILQTAGIMLPLVNRKDGNVKKWFFEGRVETTTNGNTVGNSYTIMDLAGNLSYVNFDLTIYDAPSGGWVGKIDEIRNDEFDIILTKTESELNNRDLTIVINMLQK